MLNTLLILASAPPEGEANMVAAIAQNVGVSGPKLLSQIILFSLVLFVLKKYAFGPIQQILDERQKTIDDGLANAERIKTELAAAETLRKEIVQKANEQASEIIKQAHSSAEIQAQRRIQESIREAEQHLEKAREAIKLDRTKMESELRREIVRLVAEATQRVTGKILTSEDHQRLNDETLAQVGRN